MKVALLPVVALLLLAPALTSAGDGPLPLPLGQEDYQFIYDTWHQHKPEWLDEYVDTTLLDINYSRWWTTNNPVPIVIENEHRTAEDPLIIEDLIMDGDNESGFLITIRNSTNIIVRNSEFYDYEGGVFLDNVDEITVQNNLFQFIPKGIFKDAHTENEEGRQVSDESGRIVVEGNRFLADWHLREEFTELGYIHPGPNRATHLRNVNETIIRQNACHGYFFCYTVNGHDIFTTGAIVELVGNYVSEAAVGFEVTSADFVDVSWNTLRGNVGTCGSVANLQSGVIAWNSCVFNHDYQRDFFSHPEREFVPWEGRGFDIVSSANLTFTKNDMVVNKDWAMRYLDGVDELAAPDNYWGTPAGPYECNGNSASDLECPPFIGRLRVPSGPGVNYEPWSLQPNRPLTPLG